MSGWVAKEISKKFLYHDKVSNEKENESNNRATYMVKNTREFFYQRYIYK